MSTINNAFETLFRFKLTLVLWFDSHLKFSLITQLTIHYYNTLTYRIIQLTLLCHVQIEGLVKIPCLFKFKSHP